MMNPVFTHAYTDVEGGERGGGLTGYPCELVVYNSPVH